MGGSAGQLTGTRAKLPKPNIVVLLGGAWALACVSFVAQAPTEHLDSPISGLFCLSIAQRISALGFHSADSGWQTIGKQLTSDNEGKRSAFLGDYTHIETAVAAPATPVEAAEPAPSAAAPDSKPAAAAGPAPVTKYAQSLYHLLAYVDAVGSTEPSHTEGVAYRLVLVLIGSREERGNV